MVTSNSKQDEASTQTNTTTNTSDEKKEEPSTAVEGEEGDMEGKSESKDGKAPPSPPPTDSSSDKMDISPAPTTSSSTSAAPTSGLSPSLGGLGRHRGLTEQLSRSPSSLSRVSNNMAAMSASKVTTAGSPCLSSSLTPSEQLKQQQLLQVSKDTFSLFPSLSLSLSLPTSLLSFSLSLPPSLSPVSLIYACMYTCTHASNM